MSALVSREETTLLEVEFFCLCQTDGSLFTTVKIIQEMLFAPFYITRTSLFFENKNNKTLTLSLKRLSNKKKSNHDAAL